MDRKDVYKAVYQTHCNIGMKSIANIASKLIRGSAVLDLQFS